MFKKQDSAFWWTIDNYVKDISDYKNLTIEQKKLIDRAYRLAYYSLFQYELYIGRELNDINPSDIQEISNYIINNFSKLAQFVNSHNSTGSDSEIVLENYKEQFLNLLEKIILPYIGEHSFGKINNYSCSQQSIGMIAMQLAFKNQYDINYQNKTNIDKVYYSPAFPFLITVLILDPTNPDEMYENAKKVFTKDNVKKAYDNGRMITNEENEYLFSAMDLINDDADFESMLHEFAKEKWVQLDLIGRFRMVFQLSKYTAIMLKENINSITMLEDGDNIYDLIKYYCPLILQSSEEFCNFRKLEKDKNEERTSFLYPISFKDFDSSTIENYFKKMKINRIKIDYDKLTSFRIGVIYSLSKLRIINVVKEDSPILKNFFINKNKVALVNSLGIFKDSNGDYDISSEYNYKYEEGFVDATTLSIILKSLSGKKIDKNILEEKLKPILKIISYLIALDPEIVKELDYSLKEIIKYYLICFGPYKKTKIGYDKSDINDLTDIIEKLSKNINENDKKDSDYQSTFYLISKLINFKKKTHN